MSAITLVTASPSPTSRTAALLASLGRQLSASGHDVTTVTVRDLPADALLHADFGHPAIVAAVEAITSADAVVVGTPVYKASYSGLLKALLDLLPQRALAGTHVLPIATGGTIAHLLALDYALRPVLGALGASSIGQGWFVLDRDIEVDEDGRVALTGETGRRATSVLAEFGEELAGRELVADTWAARREPVAVPA